MLIGGVIAGIVARSGWKGGGGTDKEFAFSGQATITDMGPVRDLVKQAEVLAPRLMESAQTMEALAQQQARTATAIERLVAVVEGYIDHEKTERENEEEIERRVAEHLAQARRRVARPRRKATGQQ
ncbi:MAG: hypothetical protein P4M09_16740 [Devosia sp.]|nr:hypothetical protein [Devosia sp.]